ncbi:MAG: hypothetical protein LUH17_02020 [Acidaminococcaceae bacterium]|nr:hypothetical protein [Acidaminococcaceae bacterium]
MGSNPILFFISGSIYKFSEIMIFYEREAGENRWKANNIKIILVFMQRRSLMKENILKQIRGSEQVMLQLLEELVNIDSGADALEGINAVAQKIGAFFWQNWGLR